jgi:tripartite-type tricarboxylate transporter receptor subunit TctC
MIPIVQFSALNTVMVVKSDSPYRTMNDLVEAARKNPGKISYGHPGVGTTPHMAMEQIILEKKVNIATVPFGGSTPAITALLGGHIQVAGVGTPNIFKHVQAGTMRVLVANTPKRIPQLPDVPTLAEAGMPSGLPLEMYVLVAPKGTPVPIIQKLEGTFRKAMDTPAFKTAAENFGVYTPNPLYGDALRKEIDNAFARNGEIMKKIKPAGK